MKMRAHHIPAAVLAFGAAVLLAAPLAAERLVTSVSNHRVLITSNFTGTEVVVFGTIEDDEKPIERPAGYDVVVTVRGPAQTYIARRKERVLGIWVNAESRQFIDVPSYLAVLTSRPVVTLGHDTIEQRQAESAELIPLADRLGG